MTAAHRFKPHHILLLSNYLRKGADGESYIRGTINDFKHYPQYEELYREERESENADLLYSHDFVERLARYCKELSSDPEAEMVVVDSLDSFCSLGCNRLNSTCMASSEESKEELARIFGLGIGDTFRLAYIS